MGHFVLGVCSIQHGRRRSEGRSSSKIDILITRRFVNSARSTVELGLRASRFGAITSQTQANGSPTLGIPKIHAPEYTLGVSIHNFPMTRHSDILKKGSVL